MRAASARSPLTWNVSAASVLVRGPLDTNTAGPDAGFGAAPVDGAGDDVGAAVGDFDGDDVHATVVAAAAAAIPAMNDRRSNETGSGTPSTIGNAS